jgi:hypothetical protein
MEVGRVKMASFNEWGEDRRFCDNITNIKWGQESKDKCDVIFI